MKINLPKLILLDRDGVINIDRANHVRTSRQCVLINGAARAIARINHHNIPIGVVTNQSGLARGYLNEQTLTTIHQKMISLLEKERGRIDAWFICPDHPNRPTNRRKPKPGMLFEAMETFNVKADDTIFIGDAMTDFEAAQQAKISFICVRTGKGLSTQTQLEKMRNSGVDIGYRVANRLDHAVGMILDAKNKCV